MFNGFLPHISKFVDISSFERDNVCFLINVTDEAVLDSDVMDQGLLISLIDAMSSLAGSVLLQDEEKNMRVNVSMNIKLNSFGSLYLNQQYKMKVYLIREVDKIIFYEIQILDCEDKLIKLATHLKKIIKAKFWNVFKNI